MVRAYKHTGPLTAREVVALWISWCEENELPPPEFVLLEPVAVELLEEA